jgi:hypothetical protein
MRTLLIAIMLALSAAPALAEDLVPYGCSDVVVLGRLENLDYAHQDIPDDLLGHGWMTARVHVRRVVKGEERRRVVPLRYFGHTYLRHDRTFLLVMSREKDGYELKSVTFAGGGARPALEPACRPDQPAALP